MRFDRLVTPAVRRRMLEVAREYRKAPQESESVLWDTLRDRRLGGFKFRRQQPIGAFVVDFYCDEAALVVEVDGPIHTFQANADRERQELLESLGLGVLRVAAGQVISDLDGVRSQIRRTLAARTRPSPTGRGVRGEGPKRGRRSKVRYGP